MNYFNLRIYLNKLNYVFYDDCLNDYCNSCKLIKIKRKLNKDNINKRLNEMFHVIHINLVLIKIIDFEDERYYIIFIDDYIR